MQRRMWIVALAAIMVLTVGASGAAADALPSNLTPPNTISASQGAYYDGIYVIWHDGSGWGSPARTYRVYRSLTPGGALTFAGLGPTTYTGGHFNDQTVSTTSHYYYYVQRCDASNTTCGSLSTAYGEGWLKPLLAPTGVQATDWEYTNKVHITWNAVTGATKYTVWRQRSDSATWWNLGTNSGQLYWDDTTAVPGRAYYYKVRGEVVQQGPFSAQVFGRCKLSPPTNVQASDATSPDWVSVNWTLATGFVDHYRIFRCINTMGPFDQIGTVSASPNLPYYDNDPSIGTTPHWYGVKACRSPGLCSEMSALNRGERGPALAAPISVQASDGTYSDKVRVTWVYHWVPLYYEIRRSTTAGGAKTWLADVDHPGAVYDDHSSVAGTVYYYHVRACLSDYCGDYLSNTGYRAAATPTATRTATRTPTRTATRTATRTNTPRSTPTPTATREPRDTVTPTVTRQPIQTATPTLTRQPRDTATPTLTREPRDTATPPPTSTKRPTVTPTNTRRPGETPEPKWLWLPMILRAPRP